MNEAVPGHFDYGQCKGMQFINPYSFLYRLKRRHPLLYKITEFFRILTFILIISFFILLIPSIIIIIGFIFFSTTHNFPFRNYMKLRNNKKIKALYNLSISMIIISLQSLIHLFLVGLIIFLILLFTISLLFAFSKGIYRCYNRICMRNR